MSLAADILAAVKTALEAIPSVPTVKVRKDPTVFEPSELPLVIISAGDERDGARAFGGSLTREYDTTVTVLVSGKQQIETGIDAAKVWREKVRQALNPKPAVLPLPAVAAVYGARASDGPVEDKGAAGAGYRTARLNITHYSQELATP